MLGLKKEEYIVTITGASIKLVYPGNKF
jgi:hypothetical protein